MNENNGSQPYDEQVNRSTDPGPRRVGQDSVHPSETMIARGADQDDQQRRSANTEEDGHNE